MAGQQYGLVELAAPGHQRWGPMLDDFACSAVRSPVICSAYPSTASIKGACGRVSAETIQLDELGLDGLSYGGVAPIAVANPVGPSGS